LFFFFFQAEDGIRDHCVTGVQTCALPISTIGEGIRKVSNILFNKRYSVNDYRQGYLKQFYQTERSYEDKVLNCKNMNIIYNLQLPPFHITKALLLPLASSPQLRIASVVTVCRFIQALIV